MALGEVALLSQSDHLEPMTKRATERPESFAKPVHWSNDPPPKPEAAKGEKEELSPTRYGDWVHKGIAVDF